MPQLAPLQSLAMTMPFDQFSLEEAFGLMHLLVTDISNKHRLDRLALDEISYVGGVLEINDEVEIVIRCTEHLEQVTKAEFLARFCEVPSALDQPEGRRQGGTQRSE